MLIMIVIESSPMPTFLEKLNRLNIGRLRLGTEPVLNILELLGHPQELVPTIHIAGTNGKGSVTHMTVAGLLSQDLNVGSIHSPHLMHPRERICLNNTPLSEEAFEAYGNQLWKRLEQLIGDFKPEHPEWPTYFEFMVILAFHVFKHEQVDVTVLETGLGGRLDATNVVSNPILTVITSIAYDHMDRLGDTLEEIATEKAGILRAGVPLVLGPHLPDEARNVIYQIAKANHVEPIVETTHDSLLVEDALTKNGTQRIRNMVSRERLELGLLGHFQLKNLATVLGILSVLQREGIVSDAKAFCDALKYCHWQGRFDFNAKASILLDGAHNDDGLQALSIGLDKSFPQHGLYWMLSLRNNRPIHALEKLLRKNAHRTYGVLLTCPTSQEASLFHSPQVLRQALRDALPELKTLPMWSASDPQTAWWMLERLMKSHASTNGYAQPLSVVAGSLYQLGDVYPLI
jgi:dihydrofolate synthase/folylpolyglutamate synthase